MKYTEEEKKAIERFRAKIKRADKDIVKFSDIYTTLDIHNLRLLLNLIEKQQMEIEKKSIELICYQNEYVPKEAIKEKIEEIEKYEEIARNSIEEKIIVADSDSLNFGRKQAHGKDIEILKELLEK